MRTWLCAALFILAIIPLFAQQAPQNGSGAGEQRRNRAAQPRRSLLRRSGEVSIFSAFAPNTDSVIGTSSGRSFFLTALEYREPVTQWRGARVDLSGSISPLALVTEPAQFFRGQLRSAKKIYGVGISPFGLQLSLLRPPLFSPVVSAGAGMLYFLDDVPQAGASGLNFTFHLGVALEMFHQRRHWLTLGYRFQHISNANTGNINPGVDFNQFFVAVPILHRRTTAGH